MRTGLLPLETVPSGQEMQGVVLEMAIRDVNLLQRIMVQLGRWDGYVYAGECGEGWEMAEEEVEVVEGRLKRLMEGFEGRQRQRRGSEVLLL